jgi:hypothetical protein
MVGQVRIAESVDEEGMIAMKYNQCKKNKMLKGFLKQCTENGRC